MKITLSWLKEFLETDANIATVTNTLTAIGLEVESVHNPAANLESFTVAYILEAVQHPNADKLRVCKVASGQEELQIVCGAENARAGIYVVLAPVGSVIPNGGMKIKQSSIRGVESQGMLCSAEELALGLASEGIIELPATDKDIGRRYVDVAGLNDPVIEIAITPNRGDCLGVYGIARDLAAAGIGKLKPIAISEIKGAGKSPIAVEIKNTQACSLFLGRYFRGVKNTASPAWLKQRLQSIGVNPISALVDITNYIMFSYGRPLHVYDADKLQGSLVVRNAKEGEKFKALDHKEHTLNASVPVITDGTEVQAIAGIIGGEKSGCSQTTKNVFLEIALFDPIMVAKAGRTLDIITDSRYRFERQVDPNFLVGAMAIASHLILEICGGEASEIIQSGDHNFKLRTVAFHPTAVESLTGMDVDPTRVNKILEALGFKYNGSEVVVPSWRPDIEGEADMVEEVARIIGYDHVPAVSLRYVAPRAILPEKERRKEIARQVLAGYGMLECITWSFMPANEAKRFSELKEGLRLLNPISNDLGYMRPSILPHLLSAVVRNVSRGHQDLALFEIGPVYHDVGIDAQEIMAGLIRSGKAVARNVHESERMIDIFDIKADVLGVLKACGIESDALRIERKVPSYYHPGRSGALLLGKTILAYFGQIHPLVTKAYGISVPVVGAEIMFNRIPLAKNTSSSRKALVFSDYQHSVRDFAFIIDEKIAVDDIIRSVKKIDKEKIQEVNLFDVYQGKHTEATKKSVAISVRIQASDHTLTEAELDAISKQVVETVGKLGGIQR